MLAKKPPFPIIQDSSYTCSPLDISSSSPPEDEAQADPLKSLLDCNGSGCSQHLVTNNLGNSPSLKYIFNSDAVTTPKCNSTYNSVYPSPLLNALTDLTPLPTPIISKCSSDPWENHFSSTQCNNDVPDISISNSLKNIGGPNSYDKANQSIRNKFPSKSVLVGANEMAEKNFTLNQKETPECRARMIDLKRQILPVEDDMKNADFLTPEVYATLPELHIIEMVKPIGSQMRREPNLADQREFVPKPPTPPLSNQENEDSISEFSLSSQSELGICENYECESFEAYSRKDMKLRRWKGLKLLGEGTFSKVILAVDEESDDEFCNKGYFEDKDLNSMTSKSITGKKNSGKLVAVKICEYGPKGGASLCRMEVSIKRELEFLKDINHPSIVHLKAWNVQESRVILILNYCQAGDLFEVASRQHHLLVPGLLRRIFAELAAAVHYLHNRKIVHRDIKLENVLVNLTYDELELEQDWGKYPYSVVTLTDFGLSRRIDDNEKLTTRCGSDDYASPEVIMGQPYDGRATDAWSLGVLLYALLENRLPFDPLPNTSEDHRPRSRTSHLIARVEWHWAKYSVLQDPDRGDPDKFRSRGLEGAMHITEGLLKRARSRWTLDQVLETEWVKGAITLEKGIMKRNEDDSDSLNIA